MVCCKDIQDICLTCKSCNFATHPACMRNENCIICANEHGINKERKEAHANTVQAAEQMKKGTKRVLPDLHVGDFVTAEIPKVDRGPLDGHVIGKIIEAKNDSYRVATEFGIINTFLPRASLRLNNRTTDFDQNDALISLRTAAKMGSKHGGQGGVRCLCKNGCKTKRCACKKNAILCNSKCHSSSTCGNK